MDINASFNTLITNMSIYHFWVMFSKNAFIRVCDVVK